MAKKAFAFASLSAGVTIFMYAFGAFVSFKTNIADWAEPGRFLTALVWTIAHAAIVAAVFEKEGK
jgi:hypothetical protein